MSEVPRVSVGLPVYNADQYLETAITSILGQTFRDFELIISDNASTDTTPEICAPVRSCRFSDPPTPANVENIGGVRNENLTVGPPLATGEYSSVRGARRPLRQGAARALRRRPRPAPGGRAVPRRHGVRRRRRRPHRALRLHDGHGLARPHPNASRASCTPPAGTTSTASSARRCCGGCVRWTATTTRAGPTWPRSRCTAPSARCRSSCTSAATTPTEATGARPSRCCARSWIPDGPASPRHASTPSTSSATSERSVGLPCRRGTGCSASAPPALARRPGRPAAGALTPLPRRRRRQPPETNLTIGLFGVLGSGNWGNDGSLDVVVDLLRKRFPDARLGFMAMGPDRLSATYDVEAVHLQWYEAHVDRLSWLPGAVLKAFGKLMDPARTLSWVRRPDVVVVPARACWRRTPSSYLGHPLQPDAARAVLGDVPRPAGLPVRWVPIPTHRDPERTRLPGAQPHRPAGAAALLPRRGSHGTMMREIGHGKACRQAQPADPAFTLDPPAMRETGGRVVGVGVMNYRGAAGDRDEARVNAAYVVALKGSSSARRRGMGGTALHRRRRGRRGTPAGQAAASSA